MPLIDAGGLKLHVETQGSGDPVILVAGTGFDATAWALQVPWLSEIRTVVLPDGRDSGRSSDADSGYTPADLASDLLAVAGALELKRVDVIGWSLGGAAAQELAIRNPEVVRSLVLVASWAGPDPWLLQKFGAWERLTRAFEREALIDFAALDLFTRGWFSDAGRLEAYRQIALANPWPSRSDGLIRHWQADQAHDARDRLGAVACPVLVVAGADDRLVPAAYSRELADLIPGARLRVLENAAHGLILENVHAFEEAVRPFLEEISAAP